MADTQIDVKRNETATPARQGETRLMRPDPFREFQREMDRMFDRFWRGFGFPAFQRFAEPEAFLSADSALAGPAIDLAEDDQAFHLKAELPGLSEKDVNVTVSGDMMTIAGEKREEREEKEKNFHWSERRFGSFQRMVRLPQHVDRDKIEASFKNGVLSITMPKTPEAVQQQKKIEVKAQD
jgi:HSP20 family protein